MKILNKISLGVGACFGFIIQYLGGADIFLKALLTLIVIDYVSGFLKGITLKQLSSKVGFYGISKKIMILLVLSMTVVIDSIIKVETPLREITIMFFISNESISILENVSEFIPIPEKIKTVLMQIRE